jgi:hypothetical protein
MVDQKPEWIYGNRREDYEAADDPSVRDYAASRFLATANGYLIRIAFGRFGVPVNEQGGISPAKFDVAVSMSPETAKELRNMLNNVYPPHLDHGV